eukprot:s2004_g11.t1
MIVVVVIGVVVVVVVMVVMVMLVAVVVMVVVVVVVVVVMVVVVMVVVVMVVVVVVVVAVVAVVAVVVAVVIVMVVVVVVVIAVVVIAVAVIAVVMIAVAVIAVVVIAVVEIVVVVIMVVVIVVVVIVVVAIVWLWSYQKTSSRDLAQKSLREVPASARKGAMGHRWPETAKSQKIWPDARPAAFSVEKVVCWLYAPLPTLFERGKKGEFKGRKSPEALQNPGGLTKFEPKKIFPFSYISDSRQNCKITPVHRKARLITWPAPKKKQRIAVSPASGGNVYVHAYAVRTSTNSLEQALPSTSPRRIHVTCLADLYALFDLLVGVNASCLLDATSFL